MRQELLQILDSYEDFELAFLWKYKLGVYLDDTQSLISDYIRTNRGLSTTALELLIVEYAEKAFDDGQERCPRCKSTRITASEEEYWNTADRSQLVLLAGDKHRKVKKLVCAVCDYLIQDLNNHIGPWCRFKQLFLAKLFQRR